MATELQNYPGVVLTKVISIHISFDVIVREVSGMQLKLQSSIDSYVTIQPSDSPSLCFILTKTKLEFYALYFTDVAPLLLVSMQGGKAKQMLTILLGSLSIELMKVKLSDLSSSFTEDTFLDPYWASKSSHSWTVSG